MLSKNLLLKTNYLAEACYWHLQGNRAHRDGENSKEYNKKRDEALAKVGDNQEKLVQLLKDDPTARMNAAKYIRSITESSDDAIEVFAFGEFAERPRMILFFGYQ